MANNFKLIDGDYFVSKSGHDSNDGLTPDTPKRTIGGDIEGTIIIGAGHYVDGGHTNYGKLFNFIADGKVIVDGVDMGRNYYGGELNDCNDIEFRNTSINTRETTLKNLKVVNGSINSKVGLSNFFNLTLIKSRISLTTLSQSIIINSTGVAISITSSYVDKASNFTFNDNYFNCSYSNYRGVITLEGEVFDDNLPKRYVIQDDLDGTPNENGYNPNIKWLNETNLLMDGYNGNNLTIMMENVNTCINKEPIFNNEEFEDFSLQAGSPHIGRGKTGVNVGGSSLAINIINSDHGIGNVEVVASPEIDTTNPNAYTLKSGETEGFIDYIQKVSSSNVTLGLITPLARLYFNSDNDGGTLNNKNVPDSEPSSYDYPKECLTSSSAIDSKTLIINGHLGQINQWVRVNGEDRKITSVTSTTITVDLQFRAPIEGGVKVYIGNKMKIAALKPNRLTYYLRTSKQTQRPTLLSQWDNDIPPSYDKSGHFLIQEWGAEPGYFVDSTVNSVFGGGDSKGQMGLQLNGISCKWINLRVFLRNNYNS